MARRSGRPYRPASRSRFSDWMASENDHWYPTMTKRPARSRAPTILSTSGTVAPRGLSQSTWLPPASADSDCGMWKWIGDDTTVRSA